MTGCGELTQKTEWWDTPHEDLPALNLETAGKSKSGFSYLRTHGVVYHVFLSNLFTYIL